MLPIDIHSYIANHQGFQASARMMMIATGVTILVTMKNQAINT
jgi:hypothetical protein